MNTMYDRVLSLPIFQGLSPIQLTGILEKSRFRFAKYKTGDIVAKVGQPCTEVLFLISGELQYETSIFGGSVILTQTFNAPQTMPFYTLFGMEQHFDSTIRSVGKTGVMYLEKMEFLNLLQSNKILLVNVMNILSSHAQKFHKTLECYTQYGDKGRIARWLITFTNWSATNTVLEADTATWCKVFQMSEENFKKAVEVMIKDKVLELKNGKLKLLDRYALKSYIEEKIG